MSGGRITVAPNDARDRMILSLVIDGGAPISAVLVPSKVDELVEKIGFARAAMNDHLVSESGPLAILEFTVANPAWRASANLSLAGDEADSIALGFQHSHYGWLSFVLPDGEARALGQWLVQATTIDLQGD